MPDHRLFHCYTVKKTKETEPDLRLTGFFIGEVLFSLATSAKSEPGNYFSLTRFSTDFRKEMDNSARNEGFFKFLFYNLNANG